jgi:hypothetical protein
MRARDLGPEELADLLEWRDAERRIDINARRARTKPVYRAPVTLAIPKELRDALGDEDGTLPDKARVRL